MSIAPARTYTKAHDQRTQTREDAAHTHTHTRMHTHLCEHLRDPRQRLDSVQPCALPLPVQSLPPCVVTHLQSCAWGEEWCESHMGVMTLNPKP